MTSARRRHALILAAALVIAILFSAGASWYARGPARTLPALSDALGEVWMARAARHEAAGAIEKAHDDYARALSGRFHGPFHRNHCQKRMGVALYLLGRHEEALPHLQAAQASPHRSLNGYGPLVDVLLVLGRVEEAGDAAREWLDATAGGDPGRADAEAALGKVALQAGDVEAAREWLAAVLEKSPRHPCRAFLAKHLAQAGERERAREEMAAYLRHAPPGKDTADHWALLEAWAR